MINAFFFWSGVVFWLLLLIPVGWFVKVAGVEAYRCAVFTIRRIRYLPHGGFKEELPLYRTALSYWFHLWWGSYQRPPYVHHLETDVTVWFPGKENSETVYEAYHARKPEENR